MNIYVLVESTYDYCDFQEEVIDYFIDEGEAEYRCAHLKEISRDNKQFPETSYFVQKVEVNMTIL